MTSRLSLSVGIILATTTIGCGSTKPVTANPVTQTSPNQSPNSIKQDAVQDQKDMKARGNVANLGGIVKDESQETSVKAADQVGNEGTMDKSEMQESIRTGSGGVQTGEGDKYQVNGSNNSVIFNVSPKETKTPPNSSSLKPCETKTYQEGGLIYIHTSNCSDTLTVFDIKEQMLTVSTGANAHRLPGVLINPDEPKVNEKKGDVETKLPAVPG